MHIRLFKPGWWSSDTVWLSAMSVVAISMFVGYWVIGPAISTDSAPREALRSAQFERLALDEARARPDPSPYRTPTPAFETPARTNYAQIAKQKARRGSSDDGIAAKRSARRRGSRGNIRRGRFGDRHTGMIATKKTSRGLPARSPHRSARRPAPRSPTATSTSSDRWRRRASRRSRCSRRSSTDRTTARPSP